MGGVHPFSVPCTESVDPQGEKRKAFHNKGEGNAVSEKSIRARYRRKVRVIVHVGVGKSENEDGRGASPLLRSRSPAQEAIYASSRRTGKRQMR